MKLFFGLDVSLGENGDLRGQRVREDRKAATELMLRARLSLRQELVTLERNVRQLAQEDPA